MSQEAIDPAEIEATADMLRDRDLDDLAERFEAAAAAADGERDE